MIFISCLKIKSVFCKLVGSDQWGTIVSGVDLIRRILKKDSFGLTTPLITLASWIKNGKN